MNDDFPRDAIASPRNASPGLGAASPMMVQYQEIKRSHPGYLLFYRMGDFYELFFDDAVKAGPALGIALGEILRPERLLRRPALSELLADWNPALTPLVNARFDSDSGRRRLESFYGVKALDGFGNFRRAEIAAGGALVDYVSLTQQPGAERGGALHLAPPVRVAADAVMQIDAATRRNL